MQFNTGDIILHYESRKMELQFSFLDSLLETNIKRTFLFALELEHRAVFTVPLTLTENGSNG